MESQHGYFNVAVVARSVFGAELLIFFMPGLIDVCIFGLGWLMVVHPSCTLTPLLSINER